MILAGEINLKSISVWLKTPQNRGLISAYKIYVSYEFDNIFVKYRLKDSSTMNSILRSWVPILIIQMKKILFVVVMKLRIKGHWLLKSEYRFHS